MSANREFAVSAPMLREATDIYHRHGDDWVQTLNCRAAFGTALRLSDQWPEAEKQYRLCIAGMLANLPKHPELEPSLAAVRTGLGSTLLEIKGRETEAEEPLLASLEYRRKANDVDKVDKLKITTTALERLKEIYLADNRLERAKNIDDHLRGDIKVSAIAAAPTSQPTDGK